MYCDLLLTVAGLIFTFTWSHSQHFLIQQGAVRVCTFVFAAALYLRRNTGRLPLNIVTVAPHLRRNAGRLLIKRRQCCVASAQDQRDLCADSGQVIAAGWQRRGAGTAGLGAGSCDSRGGPLSVLHPGGRLLLSAASDTCVGAVGRLRLWQKRRRNWPLTPLWTTTSRYRALTCPTCPTCPACVQHLTAGNRLHVQWLSCLASR